jgi:hypothetical protein
MAAAVLNSPRALEMSIYVAQLVSTPTPKRRAIGFTADLQEESG